MLEWPTVSPWRTSTNRIGADIASALCGCGVVERIQHQSGQQLWMKVGRLLGHHGPRVADRLDVAYRRRIHQEGAAGRSPPDVSRRPHCTDFILHTHPPL